MIVTLEIKMKEKRSLRCRKMKSSPLEEKIKAMKNSLLQCKINVKWPPRTYIYAPSREHKNQDPKRKPGKRKEVFGDEK